MWINGVYMKKTENRINFNINNKREWCRLLKFEIIAGDLELDDLNLHLPWELELKFNENIGNDTTSRLLFTKTPRKRFWSKWSMRYKLPMRIGLIINIALALLVMGRTVVLVNPKLLNKTSSPLL